MKPIIIVIMAVVTIIPVLRHTTNTVNSNAKKTQQPAKKTEERKGNDYLFHEVNVKFRVF